MVWALQTNALFEDALRSAPARPKDENVVAGPAGTTWTGTVVADSARTPNGTPVLNRFFVDLPDIDFMYPGDVLHYYIQAMDSDGRITTLPANTAGFLDFTPIDRLQPHLHRARPAFDFRRDRHPAGHPRLE